MKRPRHALLVLSLVALFAFIYPMHTTHASEGVFTNFWCSITNFFGFTCNSQSESIAPAPVPEVSVATPPPLPMPVDDYQIVNSVTETPAPNTTIIEEHNTYTTNPTTVIYQNTTVNDDKISDIDFLNLFHQLTALIKQSNQQNPVISRDLFAKQVDKIYEKSNDSTDNVQDNLDTLQTNNAASFATELLTVTGNTSIDGNTNVGGDLSVAGSITAGILNVSALSSAGALVAPYFTATSTTDVNTFMGNVGIGTTTPSAKLTVVGNIDISNGSAYTYNGANVITASTTLNNYFFGGAGNLTMTGANNIASGYQAFYLNTTGYSNSAYGVHALYSNTTGYWNTANGAFALQQNTTGAGNTANGASSLRFNTTGSSNTAYGMASLYLNTTGSNNTAIGVDAIKNNVSGSYNTAIGQVSLYSNAIGSYNTAVGHSAGYDINTATSTGANTVIGYNTGRGIVTGINNTILGANVTGLSSTLSNNIIIADGAGNQRINVDSSGNVGIGTTSPSALGSGGAPTVLQIHNNAGGLYTPGMLSLSSAVTDSWGYLGQIAFGSTGVTGITDKRSAQIQVNRATSSLSSKAASMSFIVASEANDFPIRLHIQSDGNIGIGTTTPNSKLTVYGDINISDSSQGYKLDNNRILYASTTNFSTLAGIGAGQALLSDGLYNTVLGYQALYTATSSDDNTAVGYQSLFSNTTGYSNTANGVQALYANITGISNTANGYQSLFSNTTGYSNTANGVQALYANTTGDYNTANGRDALYANTTGYNNTANGFQSLYSNTTGINNVANGSYSLYANITGANNTANGFASLLFNTTGSYNTALGYNAGRYLTDGSSAASTTDYSLFLGYNTKALTADDQNAVVIGYDANGLGSNTVVLGNDSIVTTALKGNVGIGTTTPTAKLSINSTNATDNLFQIATTTNQGILTVNQRGWLSIGTPNTANGNNQSLLSVTGGLSDKVVIAAGAGALPTGPGALNVWTSAMGINTAASIAFSDLSGSNRGGFTFNDIAGAGDWVVPRLDMTQSFGGASEVRSLLEVEDSSWAGMKFTVQKTDNTALSTSPAFVWNNYTTELMRISNNGNLGIGTTTPSTKLAVVDGTGSLIFQNLSQNNLLVSGINSTVVVDAVGSSFPGFLIKVGGSIRGQLAAGTNPTGVGLYAGGTSNGIDVLAGGNIGIGTSTPSSKLTVTQSAQSATGGLWLSTSDNTDFRSQYMNTSGVLSFYGGDTAGTLNTATLNAAGEWTNASDISYKENIEKLSYGLDTVLALQPRSYDIKNTNNHRIGFIAQEVEEVIPEVVSGEEGSKGISYGNLVAVAISAIQELAKKVSDFATLFKSERIETNTLCVGNTCVTEAELQELLQNKSVQIKFENNIESNMNTDISDNESPVEVESVATNTDNLPVEFEEFVDEGPHTIVEIIESNSVESLEN